jgi:hypothetical protein
MTAQNPLRRDNVLSRTLDDECILYDTKEGSVHVLNSMAEFVWKMCDGSNGLDDIVEKICEVYEVPPGREVRKDVEGIIRSFTSKGILAQKEA